MSLIHELKRRNVFRIAIAYGVGSWALLQVADLILENLAAPDWIMRVIMLALLIGLPIALALAWVFEWTPEGLKRESDSAPGQQKRHGKGVKLEFTIIGALVLALSYFVYDKFAGTTEPVAVTSAPVAEEVVAAPPRDMRSIAVLPFTNNSNRDDDQFFADGIHGDLMTSLAKIGSLKVISRTSVMQFASSDLAMPQIAEELGVATILEGGIQRSAGQVRINVQLVDAFNDEFLWAENYDRELSAENLFSIQSEISLKIVEALEATLSDRENQNLTATPTKSLEAYGEFVLGRQEVVMRTVDSLNRAQSHFEKAIEIDQDYALAYVGLADTLDLLSTYGDVDRQALMVPRQQAINKALELDPLSGEAFTSLAALRTDQARDDEAEQHFLKAIELSPGYVTASHWYSFLLNRRGRFEESLLYVRKAMELDPASPILTSQYARVLWNLGRVEAANAAILEGVKKNPLFPNHYTNMATNLREMGKMGESMQWLMAYQRLDSTPAFGLIALCKRYLDFDDEQGAVECFNEADEKYPAASIGSRVELWQFRNRFPEALEEAGLLAGRFPNPFAVITLGWNHLNNGNYEEVLSLVRKNRPGLLDGTAETLFDANDLNFTVLAGYSLYASGEQERGNILLDMALTYMAGAHRIRGEGYSELDVIVHVLRGDKQLAIQALEEAIDIGWRDNWWRLRYPFYDVMEDEPEWNRLVSDLEADIAAQWQWYEEHKDDPLF
jgi:TolB-like protein/Tfp pilus assembly protein PilF